MFSLSMFPDRPDLRDPKFKFRYGFRGFSLSSFEDNYWLWLTLRGRWPFLL